MKKLLIKLSLKLWSWITKLSHDTSNLPFEPDTTTYPNGMMVDKNGNLVREKKYKGTHKRRKYNTENKSERMPFGKYKGVRIEDINDVNYLKWLMTIQVRGRLYSKIKERYLKCVESIDSSAYEDLHSNSKKGKKNDKWG